MILKLWKSGQITQSQYNELLDSLKDAMALGWDADDVLSIDLEARLFMALNKQQNQQQNQQQNPQPEVQTSNTDW